MSAIKILLKYVINIDGELFIKSKDLDRLEVRMAIDHLTNNIKCLKRVQDMLLRGSSD